jgi:hypothetical protein
MVCLYQRHYASLPLICFGVMPLELSKIIMKKVPLHSIEEIYIIYNLCDRISGVLVSVLALSVVYSGFDPQSSQRL